MTNQTRRSFLKTSTAGLATTFAAPAILSARSPNETVRIAGAGVGGKGWVDINGAAKHGTVVAFCDVETGDNRRGGYRAAAQQWPDAKAFTDFRKMLEHAPITMMALQMGIAVYTQKPLTRTVYESRQLTAAAAEAGVSTQMGNQHHSGKGYRTLVEIVQGGHLGKIQAAHTWSNRPIWPQGIDRPEGSDPVPETLNWNHWLGVAEERPYKKETYHPFKWRGWYDFGAGALGDMGCHIIDPVVWSLDLGPAQGVKYRGPGPNAETFPEWEILTYRFAGTNYTAENEFNLVWYDGGKKPSSQGSHLPDDSHLPSQGVLLIGEEGSLVCGHGKLPKLYPEENFATADLPQAKGLDHYGVWIDGVKTGNAPNSNFGYAGPLTETVLLGVIASRVGGDDELQWDAEHLKFSNSTAANQYVKEDYRDGWEFQGLS